MREIVTKLYTFNELPTQEARDKAVEDYRNSITDFWWADEALESLKAFAEHFGSKLENWSIDFFSNSYSYVKFADVDEIDSMELMSLIESMGRYDKETLRGLGECKLTGICYDDDACDGARIAYYKYNEHDVKALLQAGFQTWLKACQDEAKYEQSEEYIVERLTEDDYEFTEDGTMWKEK